MRRADPGHILQLTEHSCGAEARTVLGGCPLRVRVSAVRQLKDLILEVLELSLRHRPIRLLCHHVNVARLPWVTNDIRHTIPIFHSNLGPLYHVESLNSTPRPIKRRWRRMTPVFGNSDHRLGCSNQVRHDRLRVAVIHAITFGSNGLVLADGRFPESRIARHLEVRLGFRLRVRRQFGGAPLSQVVAQEHLQQR